MATRSKKLSGTQAYQGDCGSSSGSTPDVASIRCANCRGPYHEATGWVLGENTVLCGPCAKEFAKWYKDRMGRMGARLRGMTTSFAEEAVKSIIGD